MLRIISSKQSIPLLSCEIHPAEGFRSLPNCSRTLLHVHKSSPRNIRAKSCTIISMCKKSHVPKMCALGDWLPPLDLPMKTVGWVKPWKNPRQRSGCDFQLTWIGNKDFCLSSPLLSDGQVWRWEGTQQIPEDKQHWPFTLQTLGLSPGGRSQVCQAWKMETSRSPERCDAQIPEKIEEGECVALDRLRGSPARWSFLPD